MARVSDADMVADLGAGDGQVLALCWRLAKARGGRGYEINEELCEEARKRLETEGCPANSYIISNEDVMGADISDCSVVFIWCVFGSDCHSFPPCPPLILDLTVCKGCNLGLSTCSPISFYHASAIMVHESFHTNGPSKLLIAHVERRLV